MENTFEIQGGNPLKGDVHLSGAKNAALKILIAALLFSSEVRLQNVPRISDIEQLIKLLQGLGVKAEFVDSNTVYINPSTLSSNKVDLLYGSKIRVSFLLFAPLLYKFGETYIPNPGGCRIGARPIDRITSGIEALGVEAKYDSESGYYHAKLPHKPEGEFTFPKPTHTGTELMIMMSVFCKGTIKLHNVALEPEIDDLIQFLNAGGAKIQRQERSIVIEGVDTLTQTKPHTIVSDRIEAATFAVAGLATKGEVTIRSIPENFIKYFNDAVKEMGALVEEIEPDVWKYTYRPLKAVKVQTAPHPGFGTDSQPLMAVLMTQAEGTSLIHETIFEDRFSYVSELKKLGAKIEFITPIVDNPDEIYSFNYNPDKEYKQAIEIMGPQKLHEAVITAADLRAGATLAIAALVANGKSYVKDIHHLERGYEDFIGKIRSLGGKIERVNE